MAKAFRPTVSVNGEQKQFPTYAEVKKQMRGILTKYNDQIVSVYRHRRGEWGEWFEHWKMVNNKPTKVKQGWM